MAQKRQKKPGWHQLYLYLGGSLYDLLSFWGINSAPLSFPGTSCILLDSLSFILLLHQHPRSNLSLGVCCWLGLECLETAIQGQDICTPVLKDQFVLTIEPSNGSSKGIYSKKNPKITQLREDKGWFQGNLLAVACIRVRILPSLFKLCMKPGTWE